MLASKRSVSWDVIMFQHQIPAHESWSRWPLGRQSTLVMECSLLSTARGGKPPSFGQQGTDTKSAVCVWGGERVQEPPRGGHRQMLRDI